MTRLRAAVVLVAAAALIVVLPLVGLALAGQPIAPYLPFPPRTEPVRHAGFSADATFLLALPLAAFLALLGRAWPRGAVPAPAAAARFPGWAWLGVALVATGWFAAWTRDLVPLAMTRHSFSLIWFGYILVVNGLIVRRGARAPLLQRPRLFWSLFALSGGFWWLFEYLNQFVDNWYYTGIDDLGDLEYFLRATLPFATVLPAVLSTWVWLRTFGRLDAMSLPPLAAPRAFGALSLLLGAAGLLGIGLWPEQLYVLLWVAPLLLLLGLQRLVLGDTVLAPLARGDWRPLLQPALAALVCGFFWEMWNWGSLAQWHYSIPYAQRFHLFEMPLLGYAGYFPFGMECAAVIDLASRAICRRPYWE